jgi:hypothetical protein
MKMHPHVNYGVSPLFFLFFFSNPSSRYDCDLNQWNFCEEFNFREHETSVESGGEEDVAKFYQDFAETYADDHDKSPAPKDPEVLPDADDIQNDDALQLDGGHRGHADPEDDGGTSLDHISQTPFFCNEVVVDFLADHPFEVPSRDIAAWGDGEDFLAKRYGLLELSGKDDTQEKRFWNKKLGLNVGPPDEHAVQLYDSVRNSLWPPLVCDLSTDITPNPQAFPIRHPSNILAVSRCLYGYVVAIEDGRARPWKLLISDPLTILQLEREEWCLDGNSLVVNLVKKGIPFEVLHTSWHERGPFPDHPGPDLHPNEKHPLLVDYFAYRHDLVDILQVYPHTHAAALCAGGILWRVAVDALPLPSEEAIVGPFHRAACISRTIDGVKYWTPRLLEKEEQVLVGVYRWATSK